jgi:hypothetical protein
MDNAFANLPVPHFFRWLALNLTQSLAWLIIIPGLIWSMNMLKKTGYREIDVLWFFVPIASAIVSTRTQWRYCADTRYWDWDAPEFQTANDSIAA